MNFLLLQINDSAFPIGSYTQSFGLETYIQHGLIKNKDNAYEYLKALLHTQMLYTDLLAIKLVYSATDLQAILHIESLMNAAVSAKETRQGMQKLGARFIKTLQSMDLEHCKDFIDYSKASKNPTHPSAYAIFCKTQNIAFNEALQSYIYAQTSNALTNCVKLVPLSQYDGQAILSMLHQEFKIVCSKIDGLSIEDFCNANAHNDIKAMQHEALHSRLYMS